MNTNQINKLVDKAYTALDCLNHIDWTPYRNRCFDMACEEERGHRKGAPNGHEWPRNATVAAAGRFFVVLRIAQTLTKHNGRTERSLTIKDLLHCQPSAIYAASIVANYGAQIVTAWQGLDVAALADLDYVEFVRDGETA